MSNYISFIVTPFDADPRSVLAFYRKLDGVISARFHGMIFGNLAEIPILALAGNTLKNQSFIRDYPSDRLFVNNGDNLAAAFGEFIECVFRFREARLAADGSSAEASERLYA